MARQIKVLTDLQIKNWIKAGNPVVKSDGEGLCFTFSKAGTASWILRYRYGGKQKELTLGNYPDLTLTKARELAAEKRVAVVVGGVDVARLKREQKNAALAPSTVKDLCSEYFERTIKGRIRRPDFVKSMLDNNVVHVLGAYAIDQVKPIDVDRMIAGIVRRGSPVMANRVLTVTKSVFDYAVRRHWIEYNPASAFVRKDAGGEENARQRSLSDNEIIRLFKSFDEAGTVFRIYDLATRLLLLTATRKAELIEASWSEFDLAEKRWTIPTDRIKTGDKSKRDFCIPLPPVAVEWLEEIRRISVHSDYVFPPRRRTVRKTLCPETMNWALDSTEHGLDHFTIHDLRRTARTHLASLGVKPHVAERCLNHRLPGINDIYDTHDYLDERREALELWANKLNKLIAGEQFNIVPIRSGVAA